jgi:hypothetical protein
MSDIRHMPALGVRRSDHIWTRSGKWVPVPNPEPDGDAERKCERAERFGRSGVRTGSPNRTAPSLDQPDQLTRIHGHYHTLTITTLVMAGQDWSLTTLTSQ